MNSETCQILRYRVKWLPRGHSAKQIEIHGKPEVLADAADSEVDFPAPEGRWLIDAVLPIESESACRGPHPMSISTHPEATDRTIPAIDTESAPIYDFRPRITSKKLTDPLQGSRQKNIIGIQPAKNAPGRMPKSLRNRIRLTLILFAAPPCEPVGEPSDNVHAAVGTPTVNDDVFH